LPPQRAIGSLPSGWDWHWRAHSRPWASVAAQGRWAQQARLSALTLTIILGIVVGNTFFPAIATRTAAGVDLSKSLLLRAGIILYGFRITFQQIADVGWSGVLIDALVVTLTFLLAVQLGTRVFKLDCQFQ
jgi:uncharacterized integral membrane protein (TIGR00698 family)